MKKNIFFVSISMFVLVSCSSNKNLGNSFSNKVEDSENYFNSKFAISSELAKAMIEKFPKHKHRDFGKKKLDYERAIFDTALLGKILRNSNVDSIKFFLARSEIRDSTYKFPTIVLQVKLNSSFINGKGKGARTTYNQYQYFSPESMCPPPSDCMVEQMEQL